MPRNLSDAVVDISGAPSGIGRATALRFAKAGSAVVLAARREGALQEVAHECEQAGGTALVAPTDVWVAGLAGAAVLAKRLRD